MDVVSHQAIGMDLAAVICGLFSQVVQVETVILVRVKTRGPIVAPLNQMERDSRNT